MGKEASSAPPPPDPSIAIKAQGAENKQAAIDNSRLSAIDIYGPNGSVVYKRRKDGTPFAQVTKVGAIAQDSINTQNRIANNLSHRALDAVNNAPRTPFTLKGVPYDPSKVDTSKLSIWSDAATKGLPYDPTKYGDVSKIDKEAASRVYGEFMRTSGADFDAQTRQLTRDLSNRGIAVGSDAWNRAYSALQMNQDSARRGAANQAYLTGHQVAGDRLAREQSLRSTARGERVQDNTMGNADWLQRLQTEQNLRGSIIDERERVRNQSINDATIYLTGAPAIAQPESRATPTYSRQAVDVGGLMQQGFTNQMELWNAKNQQKQGFWNGVGNAASTAASLWMMSSAAFKEDVGDCDLFLRHVEAVPVKTWRYTKEHADLFGETTDLRIGPMAEDWAKLFGGPTDRINIHNAVFILYRAVQELSAKVRKMDAAHDRI